ncbi:MAG: energy transducer TonB [Mariprofundaceae bacterium]|nr:energy transducer TonB [Mariprofundaceae bacterium]
MMNSTYGHQKQSWHFAGGFLLSIGIHAVLLLQLSQMNLADAEIPHQLTFVEVELVHMAAAQEVPQDTSPEISEPENNVQEEPKLVKKEMPQPKVVKKPVKKVVKKKVKPQSVEKPVHTSKLITNNSVSTNTTVKAQFPSNHQVQLKQLKQHYLSRILSKIQSHKNYPYSARRRHIEGDVHVSFMVDAQGHISGLHLTGGSSALRLSTRRAIEDSLPFPVPSAILSQSMHSQFVMQYRLK